MQIFFSVINMSEHHCNLFDRFFCKGEGVVVNDVSKVVNAEHQLSCLFVRHLNFPHVMVIHLNTNMEDYYDAGREEITDK